MHGTLRCECVIVALILSHHILFVFGLIVMCCTVHRMWKPMSVVYCAVIVICCTVTKK